MDKLEIPSLLPLSHATKSQTLDPPPKKPQTIKGATKNLTEKLVFPPPHEAHFSKTHCMQSPGGIQSTHGSLAAGN
jgi:hypothetical protein